MGFTPPRYASPPPPHHRQAVPVVIAGGGVVGLTLALDLARRGVPSVVLDDDDTVATGSRAICWAKRTLEIFGRLGLGAKFLEKGVTWNRGRVFHGEREAYAFDLLPEQGHEYPAFVNLQQYYVEHWLVEACAATGLVDLRWKHRLAAFESRADGVGIAVDTPAGAYTIDTEWLLACDGARSTIREAMALPFSGQTFRDRFLIADVRMRADFPTERWFWFDPPFHRGQSVLLHKQPDDVWRIDFQLGRDADPEIEREPERVRARVAAMLGPAVAFELEWVSVYTFRCRRIERFRHGRIVFAGDSCHQVSPFGARGGNGGVQDADNLGWKLAAVLYGEAPEALLDTYDLERGLAADENILNATRSIDFMTPPDDAARAWRDAVLELAGHQEFARPLVNSGRLSRPAVLAGSPLLAPDHGAWEGGVVAGAPAVDAQVLRDGEPDWLLARLASVPGFALLRFDGGGPVPGGVTAVDVASVARPRALFDHSGLAAGRYGATPGDAVLLRPDQHVAARFRGGTPAAAIAAARDRALGHDVPALAGAA